VNYLLEPTVKNDN